MSRFVRRACALVAIVIMVAVPAGTIPAYASLATGTITGRFIDADGNPLSQVFVSASGSSGGGGFGVTAADGSYTLGDLSPGSYTVAFQLPESGLTQWAHGKTSAANADQFAVTAGATTVVDERLLPTGSMSGRLTDSGGNPVPSASVAAFPADGSGNSLFTTSGPDGRYTFPRIFPGSYKVEFRPPGGAADWAHQKRGFDTADVFTVVVGGTTTVDEQLPPTGTIAGHLVDLDGTPAVGYQVQVFDPAGSSLGGSTDASGFYQVSGLFEGAYTVSFTSPDAHRSQWAHQKLAQEQADQVTVVGGQVTTVDDTLLPTGNLRLTAHDAITGDPIMEFCVNGLPTLNACPTDGVVVADGITARRYDVSVLTFDGRHLELDLRLQVDANQTATVDVAVPVGGSLRTVVTDRQTGAPAVGCLNAVALFSSGAPAEGEGFCPDDQGRVTVGPLAPGPYQLLVKTNDGVHGWQWVTTNGGTGDRLTATIVTVTAGQTTSAPPVRLDPAGSISGTVTDAVTGVPVPFACVSATPLPSAWERAGACPAGTDAAGHYTINNLGPYAWPVEFTGRAAHEYQWSGGANSHLLATPVKVTAGQTATATAKLRSRGGTIRGKVVDSAGRPFTDSVVSVVNAFTGDGAAFIGEVNPDGTFEIPAIGPQFVKVTYSTGFAQPNRWVGGSDFLHARPILVVDGGTTTLTLVVPTS